VRFAEGGQDLWQARLSDGALRALTRTPAREESWPYWSEAARLLVFEVSPGGGEEARSDLLLLDPATGSERPLARTPARAERWPAWSPDGSRIAYAFWGGEPAAGIALVDPATGGLELLAGDGSGDSFLRPVFAPDGARLVAQRRRARGKEGDSDLWLLAPGAAPKPLLRDPEWFDWKPQFSRDGSRVFFSRRPARGGPNDLASVAIDGGDLRPVVAGPADESSAAPSPTRDEMAFVSDREGASGVFLAGLTGEGARALSGAPGWSEFAPRWSPDGERIALVAAPAALGTPRLLDRASLLATRLRVRDREGSLLLDTPGFMADWMPPWR
jgi:Tol biopolymer transport system component